MILIRNNKKKTVFVYYKLKIKKNYQNKKY